MATIKQHIVDFFLFTLFGVVQGLNWGNFISAATGIVAFILIVVTVRLRLKESSNKDKDAKIKDLEIDIKRHQLKDLEEEDDQDNK